MKAAILTCVYEKDDCLANTMESLGRQETPFKFDTIVIDDCSTVDPKRVIHEHHPTAKVYKTDGRTGGRATRKLFFDHIEGDVDTLVFLSADVVLLQVDLIEQLCKGVSPGVFTMAQVKDHYVLPTSHNTYEFFCQQMLDMWDVLPGAGKIYSGSSRPDGRWYFFCTAIRKEDALKLGMDKEVCCDAVLDKKLREHGMQVRHMDHLKAIHQSHEWVQHPCMALAECAYSSEFRCKDRGVTQG